MKNGSPKSPRRNGAANGHREPPGSLEAMIVEMARSGELAKAARRAIRQARSHGLPITFRRGDQIIEQQADGSETILGRIPQHEFKLPKGVKIIEGT